MESKSNTLKIWNAVKTGIDGISGTTVLPNHDCENLVSIPAYAYHHESLGPADKPWPFQRSLDGSSDVLPEIETDP